MNLQPATISGTVTVDLDHAVLALSDALDFIGVDEIGHAHRVALMAATCARALGWAPERVHELVQAGLMHDCGVSSTREHRAILNEIVWADSQSHCERGFGYLCSVPSLAHLAPVVLEHHTPWADLIRRGVDVRVAEAANLIYLVDRADSLHQRGVVEGRPLAAKLAEFAKVHFSPEIMAVFREEAEREAFWYAQEDPTLRERVQALAIGKQPQPLAMAEVKALAAVFGRIIDAKSPFTECHSLGVAAVARRLGQRFGVGGHGLDLLEVAALLHDIGKLRVPDELLEKHGPLTADERRRMGRHAFDTYEILHRVFGDGPVARWAAFHHEYVSGHGYPFHPEAGDLPLEARIVAVADVLQALAQRRPYRQPLSPEEVRGLLDGMVFSGKLDGEVVAEITANLEIYWKDAVAEEGGKRSS